MNRTDEIANLKDRAFQISEFVPESDIQVCEFLGLFEQGIAWFEQLKTPTPQDDRWAGLCHLVLGNRERALECLLRSVERGCHAARIDLARLYFIGDQMEEALQEFGEIDLAQLSLMNRGFYYRVLSILESERDIREAIKAAGKAWRVIQLAPEFKFIAPRVLHTLAYTYQVAKKLEKAEIYLSRAEQICVTSYVWHLKLTRLDLLFDLNRFHEAQKVCSELMACQYPLIKSSGMVVAGCVELSLGHLHQAETLLERAAEYSSVHNMYDNYFIALSYLVMVYHVQRMTGKVKSVLATMEQYADTENNQCKLMLRKLVVQPHPQPQDLEQLRAIEAFRKKTGHVSETIRAMVYKIDLMVKLRCPLETIEKELEGLVEYAIEHHATREFSEEWIFVPDVLGLLRKFHGDVFMVPRMGRILIFSINREVLEIDGEVFRLPLKKSFELLVYLCIRGKSNINQIVSDVFSDMPQDRAKNYFHQIRHVIHQKTRSISIAYDKSSRLYGIHSTGELVLDLAPYLEGQQKLEGIFLPSSGSDWVIELNQRLSG